MCIKPDQTTSGGTDKMTDRQMYQSLIQMLWRIKEENGFVQPQQCKDIVEYFQSLLQLELSKRSESLESLRKSFESSQRLKLLESSQTLKKLVALPQRRKVGEGGKEEERMRRRIYAKVFNC